MSDKTIQFIDTDYRELFRIPDGGNIRVIYPPGDDRGIQTRSCEFIDPTHASIGGNVYHIHEFAARMEALGARYEPKAQLRDAELVPFAAGEEKFFTYNREEGNTCAGHIAGDFGNSGDRYHGSWSDRENGRSTPEFQAELHSAVYALRQSVLKDYDAMLSYCQIHPEAMLDSGDNYKRYGFKLETDTRQYYTQCFFGESMQDARFMVYAYDKAAPALEQAPPAISEIQPGTADDSKMFYRNDEYGNLCVGYLRGDFGSHGTGFHHNWFENDSGRKTPEFQAEFQDVMNTLRRDILKDYKTSSDYCNNHPKAKIPGWGDGKHFGFKLETASRQYFVRCTTLRNDYFYVFAYDKAASIYEKEHGKPSVMKQIRDAQKAPRPPRKEKSPDKQKDGAEL